MNCGTLRSISHCKPGAVLPRSGKRVCVLIADDEENLADSLALVLESHGYKVEAVYSGESAVERAKTLMPDVLIADMFMEKMSGVEAAAKIAEALPGCRVLLMTGQTAIDDLKTVHAAGKEFPVLQKPFHPEALLRFLKEGDRK